MGINCLKYLSIVQGMGKCLWFFFNFFFCCRYVGVYCLHVCLGFFNFLVFNIIFLKSQIVLDLVLVFQTIWSFLRARLKSSNYVFETCPFLFSESSLWMGLNFVAQFVFEVYTRVVNWNYLVPNSYPLSPS